MLQPWARASAGMAANGAAYMTITDDGAQPDRLVAASSPVCATAQLHTHMMKDGVMEMRPIAGIDVNPGTAVRLQPGGLHVMLMQLKKPLKQGQTFPLTLTFEKAGAVTVEVAVGAPGAMDMPGMKAEPATKGMPAEPAMKGMPAEPAMKGMDGMKMDH